MSNIANVFIHGAGGSARHWDSLVELINISSNHFLYELPGHGEREDTVSENISEAVSDFSSFVKKNRFNKINIIAHSLGGLLAIKYALNEPGHVEKLVLISTASRINIHPEFMKQVNSDFLDENFFQEGFYEKIDHKAKDQIIHDLSRLKFLGDSLDFMGVSQCNLTSHLGQIDVPTLVLVGEFDRIISPRRSRELSQKIPGSILRVVTEAAHYPHLENVIMTANMINEFLKNPNENNILL